MIKPSKDGTKLWFIPPEKSSESEMEFHLVYAHVCPKCQNLVQALFLTDKRIDPKPWEEILTHQLDKDGKYKRIIPGRNDRWKSRYIIQTIGRGSSVNAELIRFNEHFDRREDVINGNICNFMAISSTIPEYRVYDMLLALGKNPIQYAIKDEHYEGIKHSLLNKYAGKDQYSFVPAVGNGPELVLISRTAYGWFMDEACIKYYKPYQPPVQV